MNGKVHIIILFAFNFLHGNIFLDRSTLLITAIPALNTSQASMVIEIKNKFAVDNWWRAGCE